MRQLIALVRRAAVSFRGSLPLRLFVAVALSIVTGSSAGMLPAAIGRAVSVVIASTGGGGKPPTPRGGVARLLADWMPGDSTWGVVALVLGITIVVVALGVLTTKVSSQLSADVTAALRTELLDSLLHASVRDVALAGESLALPPGPPGRRPGKTPPGKTPPGKTPPGKTPPGKTPPGKTPPGKTPAASGAAGSAQVAAVRLAVARDGAMVSEFAVSAMTSLPQSIATLTVLAIELVTTGAWLVLVGGAGLFVMSRLAADRASRRVAARRLAMQRQDARVFGAISETLTAAEDLRLWGARKQALAEFGAAAQDCADARSHFASALAVSGQIKRVFSAVAPLLILVVLGLTDKPVQAGGVATLLLMVPLLMVRLEAMDGLRQGLLERRPVIDNVQRLIDLPKAPPECEVPIDIELADLQGDVHFEGVTYCPPGAPRPVLSDVSLSIPAGSVVGICGPSGSGKSSLLRLLLRLDDPQGGTIRIDSVDVRSMRADRLPEVFGVLRQRAALLERSLRESLTLGIRSKVSDRELDGILERVGLTDAVNSKKGLDTLFKSRPPNFSGGEVRRLLLARMLAQPYRVGVVDEPEAGLPGATAQKILQSLCDNRAGRTHLVVTHAPALLDSDFNVVMDAGRVVAQGTHAELSESCDVYRKLLATPS